MDLPRGFQHLIRLPDCSVGVHIHHGCHSSSFMTGWAAAAPCTCCCWYQVTLEAAGAVLRDVVFAQWRASHCESYHDTLKLMSLIDLFLPYLPLQRQHLPQLVHLALQERQHLLQQRHITLQWQPEVPVFLAGQVWQPLTPPVTPSQSERQADRMNE